MGEASAQASLRHGHPSRADTSPAGNAPLRRPFTQDEVRAALALAVERRLVGGSSVDEEVNVTCLDLYRAAGEVC
jgi:hypothetical protein